MRFGALLCGLLLATSGAACSSADEGAPSPEVPGGGEPPAGPEEQPWETPEVQHVALGAVPDSVLYPTSRTQSPVTASVVARLAQIASKDPGRRSDLFAKVGDSQTVNPGFMQCFTRSDVDYGGRAAPLGAPPTTLADTVKFLLGPDNGAQSFARTSLAAKVGASASFALDGPLVQEVDATRARYAVVMYGTNDIQGAPTGGLFTYARNMMAIVDALVARGVVPILSSPPPRPFRAVDSAAFGPGGADPWVPRYSAVVRAIAEGRQIPFVDLERELREIPKFGIGSDDLHLVASPEGACKLNARGLTFGFNVRNLVTLEALHRAHAALGRGIAADGEAPRLGGKGTSASPFVVASLPFTNLQSTSQPGVASGASSYGCGRDASGPELVYELKLTARKKLRATALPLGKADVDIYLLDSRGACVGYADRELVRDVDPGTYRLIVDTPKLGGAIPSGEYLLTLLED